MSHTLILLRHGQSQWNLENRFTGWVDVNLTEKGEAEAAEAGRLMADAGLEFDEIHTSLLTRAVRTMQIATGVMAQSWVPVYRHYRLNERHYGALQGLNKAETTAKHGEDQVHVWRRSYATPPPEMPASDAGHPSHDRRYAGLDPRALPGSESLSLTLDRVLPYWHDAIAPALRSGKTVLVVAHGNSLRALVKYLDGVSDDEITGVNIPTGIPLKYTLDADLNAVESGYLGDAGAAEAAAAAVAAQAKT